MGDADLFGKPLNVTTKVSVPSPLSVGGVLLVNWVAVNDDRLLAVGRRECLGDCEGVDECGNRPE